MSLTVKTFVEHLRTNTDMLPACITLKIHSPVTCGVWCKAHHRQAQLPTQASKSMLVRNLHLPHYPLSAHLQRLLLAEHF